MLCICACMHYATGASSQAALPGARRESEAKTSNPPSHQPHTQISLSDTKTPEQTADWRNKKLAR